MRLRVTVTGVKRVDDHQAVELELESTGITNYEGEFTQAAVTYGDGEPQPIAKGASAACSNTLDLPNVFIAGRRQDHAAACSSRPPDPSRRSASNSRSRPCPTEAGGIWNLG